MSQQSFSVSPRLEDGPRLHVSFDAESVGDLVLEEGSASREGEASLAARLLAAAIGNCLSAGLRYCFDEAEIEVLEMRTRVEGTLESNDRGRPRIAGLRVRIEPLVGPERSQRVGRCLEIFEDFCAVGRGVPRSIPVQVEVSPSVAVRPRALR